MRPTTIGDSPVHTGAPHLQVKITSSRHFTKAELLLSESEVCGVCGEEHEDHCGDHAECLDIEEPEERCPPITAKPATAHSARIAPKATDAGE